jgi:hypothetical protein
MKVKLVFFLFFAYFPFWLFAQSGDIKLGFKGGFNMSEYLNDSLNSEKRATLPFIGLYLEKDFSDQFSFQPGLSYSLRGSDGLQPFAKVRYSYLDLGLNFHYKPWDFLSIYAGIQPSLILTAKMKYHSNLDSIVTIPSKNSQIDLNALFGTEISLQKGVNIGFNYQLPLNGSRFNTYQLYLNIRLNQDVWKKKVISGKQLAFEQIKEMKQSAVLVRLKTSKNIIEALQSQGRVEEANKIKEMQQQDNIRIINAFKKNFNFCPVYFFYSSSSSDIKKGSIKGNLLNEKMLADSSIDFPYNSFFVVEFDYVQQQNKQGYEIRTKDSIYYNTTESISASGTSLEALIVRNSSFNLLESPFPYAVRYNDGIGKRRKEQAVIILNGKLYNFYKEAKNPY